jgi:chemotaxis protein methyltransferase CheR
VSNLANISEHDFSLFQRFIYEAAGISLSSAKRALVCGRLSRRVQHCNLAGYGAYFRLLASGEAPAEVQIAVDLLTTNETYFFREPKHFDWLRRVATTERERARPFRVWSAASSSGEEAYSIAMVLADCLGGAPWEVVGSDISARVLERARIGHYSMQRTSHVPKDYLKRFCLRGVGEQQGTLLINRELRQRVQFCRVNLNDSLPQLGSFDVIFLRNVMIYFNDETKRRVVARLIARLVTGGSLLIGHSESLHGIDEAVEHVAPAIYRRRGGPPTPRVE